MFVYNKNKKENQVKEKLSKGKLYNLATKILKTGTDPEFLYYDPELVSPEQHLEFFTQFDSKFTMDDLDVFLEIYNKMWLDSFRN
jgi:hypothetical protein